jgi:hypothetical protein
LGIIVQVGGVYAHTRERTQSYVLSHHQTGYLRGREPRGEHPLSRHPSGVGRWSTPIPYQEKPDKGHERPRVHSGSELSAGVRASRGWPNRGPRPARAVTLLHSRDRYAGRRYDPRSGRAGASDCGRHPLVAGPAAKDAGRRLLCPCVIPLFLQQPDQALQPFDMPLAQTLPFGFDPVLVAAGREDATVEPCFFFQRSPRAYPISLSLGLLPPCQRALEVGRIQLVRSFGTPS